MFSQVIKQKPLTPQEIYIGEHRIAAHQAKHGKTAPPTIDEVMDGLYLESIHRDTMDIMVKLTDDEQMSVCYTPLVISEIAWHYAFKAIDEARQNKIKMLNPVSRKVNELHSAYYELVNKDLSPRHIERFKSDSQRLLDLCAYDFTIMYFTINNEIKRTAPQLLHDGLMTYACMSYLMVCALKQHNYDMGKLLISRIGPDKGNVTNPFLIALGTLMHSLFESCGLSLDGNIKICLNIFKKNVHRLKFNAI